MLNSKYNKVKKAFHKIADEAKNQEKEGERDNAKYMKL